MWDRGYSTYVIVSINHKRVNMKNTHQSAYIYRAAKDFHKLATLGIGSEDFLSRHALAVVANYALSVELFLKASDAKVTSSKKQSNGLPTPAKIGSNAWGHDLSDVFKRLDSDVAKLIQTTFEEVIGTQLVPLLEKCNDYFVDARYHYETPRAYDISAVRLLADGFNTALLKAFGPTNA